MTDYDLGKARGRIVIEHDERGFRRAEGANKRLATSAHRVAEGFVDAEKAQEDYEKQVRRTDKAQESLNKAQLDAQKALNRLNESQAVANRLKEEGKTKTQRYKDAIQAVDRAKNRYKESVDAAARAESKFNDEVEKVNKSFEKLEKALASNAISLTQSIQKIDDATKKIKGMNTALDKTQKIKTKVKVDTDDAMTKLRKFKKEHNDLLKQLNRMSTVGTAFKAGGIGSGVMALGGLAGLGIGGVTGYGVNGIMATVQALGQLSGLAGLMPVVLGNLAASIGTIVIGSQNMGDAFEAVASNDAEKFAEVMKKLSPSGKEFAIALNEIYPALEDFQKLIQNNLFKDLGKYLLDISSQYMPLMTESFGNFANIINGTFRDLAEWMKQAGVFEDIKTIMQNLEKTMGALAPTARMLADAFLDIMKVSSDFGLELAADFQEVVKQFRDFIQTAREDGSLAQWIRTGIESFKSLMRSIGQFASAFGTIFEIQNKYSGGFFGFIERIATAFNQWTKSTEGNAALNNFFRSITQLSEALTPVLASLANIVLGQIIPMFADFGTAIQPGILAFLKGFSDALTTLAPFINQMAGPMNQLLSGMGQAFADIAKELGPQLPKIFQLFVDAILALLPHIPDIVKEIGQLAQNFMQFLPRIADDIGDILPWLLKLGGWLLNLATTLTYVVVKIVRWIGDLFTSIDDFGRGLKDALGRVGEAISGGWGWLFEKLGEVKDGIWDWLKELPGKALEAGKSIVGDLMRGMLDKLGPLGKVAKEVAEAVSDFLPSSPAKKGPFSGSGWAKPRGEKLSKDFASGIEQGSTAAMSAGGNISQATESGIHQFVKDMLELSSFGQGIASLFNDIAENIFAIAEIATTNPITGESIFGKKWQRTVSDADLRRQQEDKAYQDLVDRNAKQRDENLKKLRPDALIPGLAPVEGQKKGPLRPFAPTAAVPGGAYPGDAALLANIPSGGRYVTAPEYMAGRGRYGESARDIGDLTKGLGDCTSSIEDLVAMMDGRPTGNRSMATGNAADWARANGFLPTDKPMPGTFQIGWNASHMQATLPGGTNFNWGSDAAAAARGRNGGGAWDPYFNFTQHWYRPVDGSMPFTGQPFPLTPGQPGPSEDSFNRMNDGFKKMNDRLGEIERNSSNQLSEQEKMVEEFRKQNPILDQAIKDAQNPNATDAQVGSALDTISQIAETQRAQDDAQNRYLADGIDSLANKIAGDRGMSQQQQDPIGTAQQIFSGAMGLVGDAFKVFDATMQSIDAAATISDTLVRGISNTEDLYNIVDQVQKFIELAGTVSQTVSDALAFAGTLAAAGAAGDGGGTSAALQAASAIFGVVTSVIQTVNATIDLAQQAYRIGTKYLGKVLSFMVGGGQGSLMGDIQFLLDQNTMELKSWSGDNPADKRSFAVPSWLQFGDYKGPQAQRMRDLNMYIGPGTDPNEAMNAAMWSIKTDQNGVFSGSY